MVAALSAVGCLFLAACSGGDARGPAVAPREKPSVTLGFTQLLPFEGTNRGLLRVVNVGDDELSVTRIGLDWPGFGPEFRQDKEVTLAPDQTMDLTLTLPEPDCAAGSAPVRGIVQTGTAETRQPLVDVSQTYVRRLWTTQCSARFVDERLGVVYGDRWARLGSGADSIIRGTLNLTRRSGDEPVQLLGVQGSVLYRLRLPGPTLLPTGRRAVFLPIEIGPANRCDEHARGQATAAFAFRLRLRIGMADPLTLHVTPPEHGQVAASAMLDRVCRARAR